MTLKEWMKDKGLTEQGMANIVGVSQTAIHRYCTGRVPRPALVLRIKKLTRGQVTERDWYSPRFLGPEVIEESKAGPA